MLRLIAMCMVLSGCVSYAEGQGVSGEVAWAFTITNTLPPAAVPPGGGGLTVIVTWSDGTAATYSIASGTSLGVAGRGGPAHVQVGSSTATATPGATLFITGTGLASAPPLPSADG